jgi:hypothetical protein
MLPLVYGFRGAYEYFDRHPWGRCVVVRRRWLIFTESKECESLGDALLFLGIH